MGSAFQGSSISFVKRQQLICSVGDFFTSANTMCLQSEWNSIIGDGGSTIVCNSNVHKKNPDYTAAIIRRYTYSTISAQGKEFSKANVTIIFLSLSTTQIRKYFFLDQIIVFMIESTPMLLNSCSFLPFVSSWRRLENWQL